MLREGPKDAPWDIEIDVDEKADLNCIAEIDTEKIQGLFLHFNTKFSLQFLKRFTNLKYLLICGAVGNLSPILECRKLEELYLSEMMIDDISRLSNLPIRRFTLERIRSKQAFLDFPALPQLEELELSETAKFSELDLIKKIPTLQVLRLYHQKTKDLIDFSSMPHLHTLHINECKYLKGFGHLLSAQSLQSLSIINTPMDFDDLTVIGEINSLKKLLLSGISYKEKDGIQLSDAIKSLGLDCKIISQI